jgi:ABC-type oligopeptide transport system substrate-binding subunit
VASFALAALLALAACSERPSSPAGGAASDTAATLRRGLGGEVATLDPQKVGDQYSEQLTRDLFEGLTTYRADGTVGPGAAEHWRVSPDGLTYTFTLRSDARWSNGDAVTAEEFVAGLRRAVDPATGCPTSDALKLIVNAARILARAAPVDSLGVTAPDSRTVVIRLERPAPYLLDVLTGPITAPLHRGSVRADGSVETEPGKLVSNGAYILAGVVPGDRIRLDRNPRYWDAAHVSVPHVEYFMIADANAELLRYRAGELDMTSTLPASQMEWARAERSKELQIGSIQAISYVVFDTTEGPLRGHPELREALSLVIDREAIVSRVLKAGQLPWYSMVAPGLGTYVPVRYSWAADPYESRVERARELVRRAGYGPAHPLRITLLHHQNESNRNTALAVGALWKEKLGVDVRFEEQEFKTFLTTRANHAAWDAMINAINADYQDPSTFLSGYLTGAPDNDSGVSNAEFDQLVNKAQLTADSLERGRLYTQAEEVLLRQYAASPIYLLVARRLVNSSVSGAALRPTNRTYSAHLSLANAAKKRAARRRRS